jgi:hypothetical protein
VTTISSSLVRLAGASSVTAGGAGAAAVADGSAAGGGVCCSSAALGAGVRGTDDTCAGAAPAAQMKNRRTDVSFKRLGLDLMWNSSRRSGRTALVSRDERC